jgi:hypothetical protein
MTQEHDHDQDWPWTLYFNGFPMPKWSNCWNLCGLSSAATALFESQHAVCDDRYFTRTADKMDLAHSVESEDVECFRICCLAMMVVLLRHQTTAIATLSPYATDTGTPAKTIFDGLRDGLAEIHRLSVRDNFAIWTVGYEADLASLNEVLRRLRLPAGDPDRVEEPHVCARRREVSDRVRSLRSSLVDVLSAEHQPKEIRRFIHELPVA